MGKGSDTQTVKQELDPRMQQMLYGVPANSQQLQQPVAQPSQQWGGFGGDDYSPIAPQGWSPAAPGAPSAQPDPSALPSWQQPGSPGLYGSAFDVFNQNQGGNNFAGLNGTQLQALQGMGQFLSGPNSLTGYNAANAVGNNLVGGLLSGSPPASSGGGGYSVAQPRSAALGASFAGSSSGSSSAGAVPQVSSYQGYTPALEQVLSGTPNNPYLQAMSDDIAAAATRNFQRNVLPGIQDQAVLAGGYGGSRQGIAEGIAMGDLNRDILSASNQLFGNAYEQAAGRQAQMAGQLSAQDLAAQQANQQAYLGNRGIDAQLAGISAQAASAGAANQLGFAQLAEQQRQNQVANALQGVGLLGSASQIPLQNLQGIFGVGQTLQGNQQGYLNAPFQNVQQLASILMPGAGLGASTTQPAGGADPLSSILGIGLGIGGMGTNSIFGSMLGLGK